MRIFSPSLSLSQKFSSPYIVYFLQVALFCAFGFGLAYGIRAFPQMSGDS